MEKQSLIKQSLIMGAIFGVVLIIYSLILYMTNLIFAKWQSYVAYVIGFAVLFFAIKSYRDNAFGGFISFGKGVGFGALTSLWAYIISAIFTFILYKFIDPELITKLIDMVEEQLYMQGIPDDQIEQVMSMQKRFMTPTIISISSIPGGVILGTILSLIASLFLKKKADPFEEAMTDIEESE